MLSLAFLVYMGYQVFAAYESPLLTEPLVEYTAYDEITVEGLFARTEQTLGEGSTGLVDYAVSEGEKVAADNVIARCYASQQDLNLLRAARALDQEIDSYQTASLPTGLYVSDPIAIEEQIDELTQTIAWHAAAGEAQQISTLQQKITTLLRRKQLVLGMVENYTQQITDLEMQRSQLTGQVTSAVTSVSAPRGGFFSAATDGLEQTLTCDTVAKLTPTQLDELLQNAKQSTADSTAVGKLVTDFWWCYCANMSEEQAALLSVGKNVTASFPQLSDVELDMSVDSISASEDGRRTVVLRTNEIRPELLGPRTAQASIRLRSVSGLRCSKSALRMVDGKLGVYVLSGVQAKFKAATILYESEHYVILSHNTDDSSQMLLASDEVITGGKDLYDGKIVK